MKTIPTTTEGNISAQGPEYLVAPQNVIEAGEVSSFTSETFSDDSTKYREDILRRYEAPYLYAWPHGK